MAIQTDVYMFFNGNCRQAMEFYQGIFGGELSMQTYKEAADVSDMGDPEMGDQIIHALLNGGKVRLMASDSKVKGAKDSGKIAVTLSGPKADGLEEIFNLLSQDGKVDQPLAKAFWGDTFGSLTDKYGIEWMVSIQNEPASQPA
jgi:PhnB protein